MNAWIVLGLALVIAGPAVAGGSVTVEDSLFCISRDSFDQLGKALVDEDEHAFAWLIEKQLCGVFAGAFPATVLETDGAFIRFRVYVNGDSAEVWSIKQAVTDAPTEPKEDT